MLPKWSQNAPKMVQKSYFLSVWDPFPNRRPILVTFWAHLGSKRAPKVVQKCAKIDENLRLKIVEEKNTILLPIWSPQGSPREQKAWKSTVFFEWVSKSTFSKKWAPGSGKCSKMSPKVLPKATQKR